MGRFSLGFAFFALAGAFFPCFGRDFFFFFFGFLGAFGSWDSGDSWGSAGAGSAAGSAAGSSRWEGCQPLVSVASGAGCSAGSSTGSGAGAVSGSCCTGLFFFLGFFCFCFLGLREASYLPADFRGGFRGLEVLHGSGGIHRLGFGFRLILRGLKALIFFRHGASSFLAY